MFRLSGGWTSAPNEAVAFIQALRSLKCIASCPQMQCILASVAMHCKADAGLLKDVLLIGNC